MEHDAWFFIGIFVFIFLIWASTGGPLHPITVPKPVLAQPQESASSTYLGLPRAPFTIGNSHVVLPGSSAGDSYNNTASDSESPTTSNTSDANVPAPIYGIYFGTPSPYRNTVTFSGYVSNASTTNEYVQISVAQNAKSPVDITGWTLESKATYTAAIIPKGTQIPVSGVVNGSQDIILQPGERAIINTGPSPVGASFRENKCIGYFNGFQKFSPSLPQNCPMPSSELSLFYGTPYIHDPACIDYVHSLARCQIPLSKTVRLNQTCESFLVEKLNYNGCITTHKNDSDFNGKTWRIYLNRVDKKGKTNPMWRTKHEVVRLIDELGKTVAQFTY